MIDLEVDILIVGGGLIGALLLHALESTQVNCLLVDNNNLSNKITKDFDSRSLALSTASVRILKSLNVWQLLEKNTSIIDKIHVSEKARFGSTLFENDYDEELGFVVEMQYLNTALHELINFNKILTMASLETYDMASKIAIIKTSTGQLSVKAKLVVAADGANSHMRNFCNLNCSVKDYGQQALVANIGIARDHKNIAYERFTKSGPLALLPMVNQRMSLVWSLSPEDAVKFMQLSDTAFLTELQRSFGYRLGRFTKVGKKTIFPLRQVTMPITYAENVVFIGNAAHTLHPVAGQGFNLGLRDVATLIESIIQLGLGQDMLEHYQKLRTHDQTAIKLFTEGLVAIFANKFPGLSVARGLGLIALDNSLIFKHLLTSYTRGFGGNIPDLVCRIPIYPEEI